MSAILEIPERIKLARGDICFELTHPVTGKPIVKSRRWVRNTITSDHLEKMAQWLHGDAPAVPNYIALGTGAPTQYAETNKDTDLSLTSSGNNQRFSQGFKVTAARSINRVLLRLYRLGTSAANLQVQIQTDNAGIPSGSVLGTSDNFGYNGVDTSYDWVPFTFSSVVPIQANVQYHLVLVATGYTYSGGVTTLFVGADQSAPSYANGVACQWNGSVYAAISPNTDLCFRVCCAVDASFAALTDESAATRVVVSSKSLQGNVACRMLSTYTAAQAVGRWGEVGLLDASSNGVLSAISSIDLSKPNTNGLNVYWIVTFT